MNTEFIGYIIAGIIVVIAIGIYIYWGIKIKRRMR